MTANPTSSRFASDRVSSDRVSKDTAPYRSPPPAERVSAELNGLLQRAAFALGPVGTGLLLDLLDLATFGPIGLVVGAVIGGYAGWVLAKYEGIHRELRLAFAICTAAYMMIPFTEPVPAATILLLLARFFLGPNSQGWAVPPEQEFQQKQEFQQERDLETTRHMRRAGAGS